MHHEIPTEFYVGFLDRTFEIHWDYHAWLMFTCWFVLVPFGIISIRYFKSKPRPMGLPRGWGKFDKIFVWWVMHIWTLYTAITLLLRTRVPETTPEAVACLGQQQQKSADGLS